MSSNIIAILVGWLIALTIFLGFIVLLRYIHYREHMALITHGFNPHTLRRHRRSGILRAGLITMMVGLSLTIGLYPVNFLLPAALNSVPFHLGPWLLPGLIPFGVGVALIVSYYLEQSSLAQDEVPRGDNIIPLEEHKERKNGSERS
jgi:hypothetical protein